ncbi:hypothetical protein FE810_09065 [Thalassotalea litorea]|uniref:Aminoglycoside phosphotransferase domain-containing protein n=1 Tax=Thalassotalea litorea TaxID=2020715 RepID=A0A5R9ILX1_9GAMM|nr:hypothetical protein [Thalassotalea litorea]TLU65067.1 hypothetical protein FE810_09065 [Thalassotalea litorea]
MIGTEFNSKNLYLSLPSIKKPRVKLAVDSSVNLKNSFKLYNPFSLKARVLKFVCYWLIILIPDSVLRIFLTRESNTSDFIKFLEYELGESFISSIYFATSKDKVVIQLQNKRSEIVGYIKFPLNETGIKHLHNEIKAYKIFSEIGIVENVLHTGFYENTPYILLKPLDGKVIRKSNGYAEVIAGKLLRENEAKLQLHPRALGVLSDLKSLSLIEVHDKILLMLEKADLSYRLAFEHGDFAPWNVIESNGKIIPLDFEFFVENGLEHMDLFKFYYQQGTLINNLRGSELIKNLVHALKVEEFDSLFSVFLGIEIVRKCKLEENFAFETSLLNMLVEK